MPLTDDIAVTTKKSLERRITQIFKGPRGEQLQQTWCAFLKVAMNFHIPTKVVHRARSDDHRTRDLQTETDDKISDTGAFK